MRGVGFIAVSFSVSSEQEGSVPIALDGSDSFLERKQGSVQ
jgi:hypothetical protein